MSRPRRRCSLTVTAVSVALLAGPAAAQAATYTVSAGGGSCAADLTCEGLAEAAVAAGVGDTFNVAPGNYTGASFNVGGVTINGAPGVVISGTMQFSADGGGTSKLSTVTVVNTDTGPPAILAVGDAGLELSDAVVVSANSDGVLVAEGTTNKIVRSIIVTGAPTRAAVRATSLDTSAADKALTIDSTLLSGGAAGLSVNTGEEVSVTTAAGDVTVNLRHVTAAGSTKGLVLNASQANTLVGGPFGNIVANVTDSIIQNGTAKTNFPGLLVVAPPNTVTDNYLRTRQVSQADSNTVFANSSRSDFRLRPDSPAINAGGFTAGESTTDFEGQDRSAAPTDQGFDEFVNAPPVAKIAVKTKSPRDNQPTEFDASGSTDREGNYGGGIVTYVWDFGDGTKQSTTTPTVSHTYKGEGDITAKLAVVDRQNAVSAIASTQFKVVDGTVPVVTITKPKSRQRINVITTKTKTVTKNGVKTKVKTRKRTAIKFAGKATDKSGVGFVLLTIEKVSSPASARVAQGRQSTSTKKCTWLDAKKGLRKTLCTKPIIIRAKLASNGNWTFNVARKIKLSKGGYRVIVYGVDKLGNYGNSAAKSLRNRQFTLK